MTDRPPRVRTNLRLDSKLYAAARAVARQQGVTLTAFVEDCLRRRLGKRGPLDSYVPPEPTRAPVVLPDRRAPPPSPPPAPQRAARPPTAAELKAAELGRLDAELSTIEAQLHYAVLNLETDRKRAEELAPDDKHRIDLQGWMKDGAKEIAKLRARQRALIAERRNVEVH